MAVVTAFCKLYILAIYLHKQTTYESNFFIGFVAGFICFIIMH